MSSAEAAQQKRKPSLINSITEARQSGLYRELSSFTTFLISQRMPDDRLPHVYIKHYSSACSTIIFVLTMNNGRKNRPCYEFLATGRCKYGEKCWYAHDAVPAQNTSSSTSLVPSAQMGNQTSGFRSKTGTWNETCRYFKLGRCRNGESCLWSHVLEDAQGSSTGHRNTVARMNDRNSLGSYGVNAGEGWSEERRINEQRRSMEAGIDPARWTRDEDQEAEKKRKPTEIAGRQPSDRIKRVIMDGSTLVTCGAGLEIQHIVCGFESCFVAIKNLPPNVKPYELEAFFTQQGVDTKLFYVVRVINDDESMAKVIFDSELGQNIAESLDGFEFRGKFLDVTVDNRGIPNKMGSPSEQSVNVLTVTWDSELSTVTMVAQYATTDDAQNAVKKLNNTMFGGREIRVQLIRSSHLRTPSTSIKISGLSRNATTTEVQRHSGADSVRAAPDPTDFDSEEMEIYLKTILKRRKGFEGYEMSPSNPNKYYAQARVRFSTWEDAQDAQGYLEDKMMLEWGCPQLRFSLSKPLQYVINISLSQYLAQNRRWESLRQETYGNKDACMKVTDNGIDKAFIRVQGEDKKAVGQLKVRVESLVAGETLDPRLWHRSFMSPDGQRFLGCINTRTKAYVRGDWKSKVLKLYDDGNAKQEVTNLIKAEIERLESLEWRVPIHTQAIGFFLRKGLPILKRELGEDAVTIESRPTPRLIIRGGKEAHRIVDHLVEESRKGIRSDVRGGGQDTCPICSDEVTSPVELTCRHVYCSACFQHFLLSAAERKTFPLVCSGAEGKCKTPIAADIIKNHLFDQLVEAAVATYIEQHPTEFRYCGTADCPQIYRCEVGGKVLTCPSCFATVCASCHKEGHEGMTCRDWEIMTNQEEHERLNEEWARDAGAKRCPTCDVWVEKVEGCNHMTCKCGTHFCWLCLRTFQGADSLITHLRVTHGGIDDEAARRERMAQEQADSSWAQQLANAESAQRIADLEFAQRLQGEENGGATNAEQILAQLLEPQQPTQQERTAREPVRLRVSGARHITDDQRYQRRQSQPPSKGRAAQERERPCSAPRAQNIIKDQQQPRQSPSQERTAWEQERSSISRTRNTTSESTQQERAARDPRSRIQFVTEEQQQQSQSQEMRETNTGAGARGLEIDERQRRDIGDHNEKRGDCVIM